MKKTEVIMGMPITVDIIAEDGPTVTFLLNKCFDEFRRVDEIFSTYKTTSEIAKLNRHEITLESASQETRDVLTTCEELKAKTQGFFDISYRGVLDPSGYVKGWSIARVEDILRRAGAQNFVVSAGGDMVCAGRRADGSAWVVGIANPSNPSQSIKNLQLSNKSIATSAAYERGEHIYNPLSRSAASGLVSVSVVGDDIIIADVYATTIFAMGKAGIDWVQEQTEYAAYIVTDENTAVLTPNLQPYIVQ
jgi:thiamine biosynthesis lipoprotein